MNESPRLTDRELDDYLVRVGHHGPVRADLATVAALARAQPAAIAFENLDPLLGIAASITPARVFEKLVRRGRGGYCFELNTLLARVLRSLGLPVRLLLARARWRVPVTLNTPRTHLALLVQIDGRQWLVDAGFGGLTQTVPLRLEHGLRQPADWGEYRLLDTGADHLLQWRDGGDWRSVMSFDLTAHTFADCEVANWYLSTHPDSPFRTHLIAARTGPDRRSRLLENRLSEHLRGSEASSRLIGDPQDVACALESTFGIVLADRSALIHRLRAIVPARDCARRPAAQSAS